MPEIKKDCAGEDHQQFTGLEAKQLQVGIDGYQSGVAF
jgi:hypothetical protein